MDEIEKIMQERSRVNAYTLLSEQAEHVPPGSEGLIVLPYFAGERTPISDPLARGRNNGPYRIPIRVPMFIVHYWKEPHSASSTISMYLKSTDLMFQRSLPVVEEQKAGYGHRLSAM